MNEYNSRALRWLLELLIGDKTHTSVYEDPILRKMKPVSPATLHEYREKNKGECAGVQSGPNP